MCEEKLNISELQFQPICWISSAECSYLYLVLHSSMFNLEPQCFCRLIGQKAVDADTCFQIICVF